MEKEIVLYQEARSLRDLGFSEECFGFFNINGDFMTSYKISKDDVDSFELRECCLAPTYGQVFRWFRDVHHIDGWVTPYHSLNGKKYCVQCESIISRFDDADFDFDTHEEAELYLLQVLLEVIKKRNHETE